MDDTELTCVYIAQGITQGEAIRAKLTAYDIPAMLKYEAAGQSAFNVAVGPMGNVRVMVPNERADYARDILTEESLPDET